MIASMGDSDSGKRPDIGSSAIQFDDLDRKIVHELQIDGRRSFRDIGRHLEIPEATIRSRVKRMRESRSLRILGFVDPRVLGADLLATILLKVRPDAQEDTISEICSWPEVMYVSTCLGRANLQVQVICESTHSLQGLIAGKISPLDGIIEIEVLTETRVHKAEYIYPEL